MGIKKMLGLKPKASSANLNVSNTNGVGYYNHPQQQHNSSNMYSIPESGGFPQQNQPRSVSGPQVASRPGPQPSFEASRSVSSGSGSAYSYTPSNNGSFGASTNSLGKSSFTTSSTNISNGSFGGSGGGGHGLGASLRNFSGASGKSTSSTIKKPQPGGPAEQFSEPGPQVTAADVRRCTKLLRQMFELHLELWTLTYTIGTDQQAMRREKRMQLEAILADIHNMVRVWHAMPPSTWSEEEYEEINWIASTLAGLPLPPY